MNEDITYEQLQFDYNDSEEEAREEESVDDAAKITKMVEKWLSETARYAGHEKPVKAVARWIVDQLVYQTQLPFHRIEAIMQRLNQHAPYFVRTGDIKDCNTPGLMEELSFAIGPLEVANNEGHSLVVCGPECPSTLARLLSRKNYYRKEELPLDSLAPLYLRYPEYSKVKIGGDITIITFGPKDVHFETIQVKSITSKNLVQKIPECITAAANQLAGCCAQGNNPMKGEHPFAGSRKTVALTLQALSAKAFEHYKNDPIESGLLDLIKLGIRDHKEALAHHKRTIMYAMRYLPRDHCDRSHVDMVRVRFNSENGETYVHIFNREDHQDF